MVRGWATLGELERLSRRRVLEALDVLEALEEAEAEAAKSRERPGG